MISESSNRRPTAVPAPTPRIAVKKAPGSDHPLRPAGGSSSGPLREQLPPPPTPLPPEMAPAPGEEEVSSARSQSKPAVAQLYAAYPEGDPAFLPPRLGDSPGDPRKAYGGRIRASVRKRTQLFCVEFDIAAQDLLDAALDEYLTRRGRPGPGHTE